MSGTRIGWRNTGPVEASRSVQRREAAQREEVAPEFDAGPVSEQPDTQRPIDPDDGLTDVGRAAAVDAPVPVSQTADYDGDSWSTPDHIIAAAREVLGEIDLDPATNEHAQARIRATVHYTQADDGLAQEWSGRVRLNPPYSQPLVGQFTERVIDEYDARNVTAAIVLVNNATETSWCQALLERCPACLFRGRLPFMLQGKEGKAGPRQGQIAFYLGDDPDLFATVFGELGIVVRPVRP